MTIISFIKKYSLLSISTTNTDWVDTIVTDQNRPLYRKIYRIGNYLMLFSILSVFALLVYNIFNPVDLESIFVTPISTYGLFIGMFIGLLFHEIGHAISAKVYKQHIRRIGVVLLFSILPIGAYVDTIGRNKLDILSAGILHNYIMIIISLILEFIIPTGFFLTIAIVNIVIILENSIPLFITDGSKYIKKQSQKHDIELFIGCILSISLLIIGYIYINIFTNIYYYIGIGLLLLGLLWSYESYTSYSNYK